MRHPLDADEVLGDKLRPGAAEQAPPQETPRASQKTSVWRDTFEGCAVKPGCARNRPVLLSHKTVSHVAIENSQKEDWLGPFYGTIKWFIGL